FDRSGKYLYFTASTDRGPGAGWLDMSSLGRPQSSAAYVMVLRKGVASPTLPESDEENAAPDQSSGPLTDTGDKDSDKGKKDSGKGAKAAPPAPATPVAIEFDGLDQRILALPIPRANLVDLE